MPKRKLLVAVVAFLNAWSPLAVGIRGGYRISGGGQWKVENGPDLDGGPRLERKGLFLLLHFGLGI